MDGTSSETTAGVIVRLGWGRCIEEGRFWSGSLSVDRGKEKACSCPSLQLQLYCIEARVVAELVAVGI